MTPYATTIQIETHPWEPFIPDDSRILFLGTFPPAAKRWSMDFYYPNPQNDFWRIMGLLLLNDKNALYDTTKRKFHEDKIKRLMTDCGIALSDTATSVRRLKGNASDKYLDIVTQLPLNHLLIKHPSITAIAATGEKAATVVAEQTKTLVPKTGEKIVYESHIDIWRMPSTSRAYPMKLEVKAQYYAKLLNSVGITTAIV